MAEASTAEALAITAADAAAEAAVVLTIDPIAGAGVAIAMGEIPAAFAEATTAAAL